MDLTLTLIILCFIGFIMMSFIVIMIFKDNVSFILPLLYDSVKEDFKDKPLTDSLEVLNFTMGGIINRSIPLKIELYEEYIIVSLINKAQIFEYKNIKVEKDALGGKIIINPDSKVQRIAFTCNKKQCENIEQLRQNSLQSY